MTGLSSKCATSGAAAKSLVVRAAACHLLNFSVVNISAGTVFLQLHDAAAVPADTAIPLRSWEMGAGQTYEWDEPAGRFMALGAVLVLSSTQEELTQTLTDDGILDAVYVDADP